MSMQREAGRVRIDISEPDYEVLLTVLSDAAAAHYAARSFENWRRVLEVVNAIDADVIPALGASQPPLAWSEQWRRP